MKSKQKPIFILIYVFFLYTMLYLPAHAAGLLTPINSSSGIEIKSHKVNVTINNGFAQTQVDQIFTNSADKDLEAVYSFPVPKNASLSELSVWIDNTEVIGEVIEKEKAKKTYESQKSKGKETAIAEKNSYKTFEVRVFPVKANNDTRIRLVYYQPLEIDLNIGRYVYPLEDGNVDEDRIAFWQTDNKVQQQFEFNATIKSAFPIKDVRLPGFQNQATITKQSGELENQQQSTYDIKLNSSEGTTLSKDILIYYRLDDTTPARVELIPFKKPGKTNGKFMLVITPGADLTPIQNGSDWTFVLDVSGSMGGNKITTLVNGVKKSIKQLSPDHRFKIITFNETAKDLTNGFVNATQENIDQAAKQLNSVKAGGSTNLYEGLEKAYKSLDADRISGIIVVTDGVANVGQHEHSQLLELHRKHDFRLFTFVIGNSANQPLLDSLAKESGGFAMNICACDDMIGRILQAKAKLTHESLYNTKVKIRGENVSQLTPSAIGNLYMGQQIVLFGDYTSSGQVTIELSGSINGHEKKWTTNAYLPDIDMDNPEIERLWAMASIEETMEEIRQKGEKRSRVDKIINLGTQYSLVTDYTSMVVFNEQEMENENIERKNASRVQEERTAQKNRSQAPAKNYRVAQKDNSGMFKDQRSPGIGTGAVGPLFIGLICFIRRFKTKNDQ